VLYPNSNLIFFMLLR